MLRLFFSGILSLTAIILSIAGGVLIFDGYYLIIGLVCLLSCTLLAYTAASISPTRKRAIIGVIMMGAGLCQLPIALMLKPFIYRLSNVFLYTFIATSSVIVLTGIAVITTCIRINPWSGNRRPFYIDLLFGLALTSICIDISMLFMTSVYIAIPFFISLSTFLYDGVILYTLILMMKGNKTSRLFYSFFVGAHILMTLIIFYYLNLPFSDIKAGTIINLSSTILLTLLLYIPRISHFFANSQSMTVKFFSGAITSQVEYNKA